MNFNPFIELIVAVLGLYKFVIIVRVILSWLTYFGVLNFYNPVVNMISRVTYGLTEPVFRKVRSMLPNLGGIDISPFIIFLAINLIDSILINYFYVIHL